MLMRRNCTPTTAEGEAHAGVQQYGGKVLNTALCCQVLPGQIFPW